MLKEENGRNVHIISGFFFEFESSFLEKEHPKLYIPKVNFSIISNLF